MSWSDLHFVASAGDVERVRELLKKGVDPNAKNEYGWTPLHEAAFEGRVDIVASLLEHGADPTVKNKDGDTPLDLARRRGHRKVVSLIEEFHIEGWLGRRGGRLGRARRLCGLRRTPSVRLVARLGASSTKSMTL